MLRVARRCAYSYQAKVGSRESLSLSRTSPDRGEAVKQSQTTGIERRESVNCSLGTMGRCGFFTCRRAGFWGRQIRERVDTVPLPLNRSPRCVPSRSSRIRRASLTRLTLFLGCRHDLAGIFHGVAQGNRRFAKNYVPIFVEHRDFVVMLQQPFSTFMIKRNYKICPV